MTREELEQLSDEALEVRAIDAYREFSLAAAVRFQSSAPDRERCIRVLLLLFDTAEPV
jgi:hypothetical protein